MKNITAIIFTTIIVSVLMYFITRNYYANQLKKQSPVSERRHTGKIPFNSLETFMRDSINNAPFKLVSGQIFKSSLQTILDSSKGNTLSIMIGSIDSLGGNNTCLVIASKDAEPHVLMMHDTTMCCRIVSSCCPPPPNIYTFAASLK